MQSDLPKALFGYQSKNYYEEAWEYSETKPPDDFWLLGRENRETTKITRHCHK